MKDRSCVNKSYMIFKNSNNSKFQIFSSYKGCNIIMSTSDANLIVYNETISNKANSNYSNLKLLI